MRTILVVDDAALMRVRFGRILERHGFRTIVAANGREAVAMYGSHRPDGVLLDITMPEMDGLSALKEIRELDSNARVAIVSANSQRDAVMEALKSGAVDFVVKPCEPERLVAAVLRLVQ